MAALFLLDSLECRTLASAAPTALDTELNNAFTFAQSQLTAELKSLKSDQFPSYSTTATSSWKTVPASDWTSGFFAGCLWECDQHFGNTVFQTAATKLTRELDDQKSSGDDLGFRFVPTDGNEYTDTGSAAAKKVLIAAAASKIATFDSTVDMFRSTGRDSTSGNPKANFPVLIDHTMDLELVYRAARLSHRPDWTAKANAHLEKLARTMVRSDGSTVQWGYFNDKTGDYVDGETRQGLSNSSTWSRGQAWAMMSFTAAAEATGRSDFLADAEKTSNYFLTNLPADGVPYWDFNAPVTVATPRDSSAAAVAADALLRLAKLLPTAQAAPYRTAAEQILQSLGSSTYLASGTKSPAILLHGARYVTKGQSDGALIFGDFYFLDAINRYEAP